jgi:Sulfotransferase domain
LNVVFCTTCKNRTPHLRETLPRNLADNPNARFVVLDYNSQDDLLTFLRAFEGEIAERRLTVYSFMGWHKFRMAHAKNLAHRLGILEEGEILVNLDADNFAGPDFVSYAQEQFSEPQIFLWTRMIKGAMTRGLGGRIVVPTKAFWKTGGYDEKYVEWSPDDKDFHLRLKIIGYKPVEIERKFLLGVTHNDRVRFKEYPHLETEAGDEFKIDEISITKSVVNEGRIGCGVVYRNFDRDDLVEVKPVATRIFGVGYPKTGTVSLHAAFQLLGYESWHWSSAHVAKRIWQEMHGAGARSASLEGYEALCDLPIPLLYEKLDKAYPGSKFILTLRNEQNWLESIRRHFLDAYNPWKAQWDSDPFSNRVHFLTYGRTDFDPKVFLDRYRAHNAAVQEYFRWRPESLLILHLDRGDGWGRLCPFLGRPVPRVPFPRKNKTNGLYLAITTNNDRETEEPLNRDQSLHAAR